MNNKPFKAVLIIEILIGIVFIGLIFTAKSKSQIVSPPLSFWQSRMVVYDNGFCVNEGDIDSSEFENGPVDLLYGPFMILPPGGYTYSIEYSCDVDQSCLVHAFEGYKAVKDSKKVLKASQNAIKGHFSVNQPIDNLELRIQYNGTGNLTIKNITVVSGPYKLICELLRFIIICGLLDILWLLRDRLFNAFRIILSCFNMDYNSNVAAFRRYDGIDVLKCIAAFMVVNIHMPFNGIYGDVILGICRCSVPIFFIISGFFYTNVVNRNREGIQIRRILVLILLSNLLYFIYKTILSFPNSSEYLFSLVTPEKIKMLLLFNDSPIEFHLWYLNAFLYVLIVFYLARKFKVEKYLLYISPILLLLGISLGKYSRIIWGSDVNILYSRGFLLEGIPFFAMGILLYRLLGVIKVNQKHMFVGMILSLAATITEVIILNNKDASMFGDIYISTVFLSLFAIMFFANLKVENALFIKMSLIGKKYSSNIYIIHILIIDLWRKIWELCGYYQALYYCRPIIVFAISLMVVALYNRLKMLSARN